MVASKREHEDEDRFRTTLRRKNVVDRLQKLIKDRPELDLGSASSTIERAIVFYVNTIEYLFRTGRSAAEIERHMLSVAVAALPTDTRPPQQMPADSIVAALRNLTKNEIIDLLEDLVERNTRSKA